jgi:predicted nucleic acid-binding protein
VILLDTGVVSAVLRRRRRGPVEQRVANTVASLLDSHESIGLPGIVFQEVLSGIADTRQFRKVLAGIRDSFPIMLAGEEDHLRAAQITNRAAAKGITASTPDALIASQAIGLESELLTVNPDFGYLADFTDLKVIFLGESDAAT